MIAPATSYADDDPEQHPPSAHHATAWHASVFAGGTSIAGHSLFTVGGEVEYRPAFWQQRLGVGALVDAALGDHGHTIAGAMVTFRPIGAISNFKLIAAPSVESSDGHRAFLMRSGVGYDVHAGAFSVSPMVSLDFVDGHVGSVFGLALGVSW